MVDLSGVGFNKIKQTADALGISVEDLLKQYSYETGTTFDPRQPGPITQHGQHRGAIQFGEPQARAAGVDFSTPESAFKTQFGPDGGIVNYATSSGFVPGQHGPLDLYSTINAGAPGLYNRTDANNGGAWGTVADKFNYQIPAHAENVEKLMYDIEPAQIAAETLATLQQTAEGGRLDHLDPDAPVVDFLSQFEGAIARNPTVSTSGGSTGSFLPFIQPVEETRGDKIKRGIFNMADNMASMNRFYKAGYRGDAGDEIVDRSLKKKSRNKTAEMLQAQGREDLANAILTQALTPQQALQMHQQDKLAQLRNVGTVAGEKFGTNVQYERTPEGDILSYIVGNRGTKRYLEGENDPLTSSATTVLQKNEIGYGEAYADAVETYNLYTPRVLELYNSPVIAGDFSPNMRQLLTSQKRLDEMSPGALAALTHDERAFISRHDQVIAGAFLDAFEKLKGAGAITQTEGEVATNAMIRMNRAQTGDEYRQAAREYIELLQVGIQRAERKLNNETPKIKEFDFGWESGAETKVPDPTALPDGAVLD